MVNRSTLRAITFDATGTLLDPYPSVGAIYAEIAHAEGLSVDGTALQDRFRSAFKAGRAHTRTDEAGERAFWRKLSGDVFSPWADATTMDRLFPALWEAFACADRWRPRGDIPALLSQLHARGLQLAMLSNWDARLHRVIAALGWRQWLSHVFISSELGAEKPDRMVFDHAAAALGCAPAEILHVGDSWDHDVAGALGAGWQAAWLDRKHPAPADPRVLHLRSLEELPGRLA